MIREDGGRKQHTTANIVVTVAGKKVEAVGRAREDLKVEPGAAAHHPPTGAGEPHRPKPIEKSVADREVERKRNQTWTRTWRRAPPDTLHRGAV